MSESKKLLIRLSSAGDILLTSPLLKVIKESEPESEIHFAVKEQYVDLIRYNPNIDRVHLVQNDAGIHQLENLRRDLLRERFDATLDLQNNFRSIYLRRGMSSNISVVNKDPFKRALLVKAKVNLFREVRPVALKYIQVFDSCRSTVPLPEIYFSAQTREKTESLWKNASVRGDAHIFLCPGARHFTKRWPQEYWVDLASKLSATGTLTLIGGEEDKEVCHAISKQAACLSLCGELSLIESAAMLSYADVVVTNDSFIMHAANALGKRIVAIFGSTVREFGFFPYGVQDKILEVGGLHCRPCSHIGREYCPKGHFRCMLETKPEMVHRATMELL